MKFKTIGMVHIAPVLAIALSRGALIGVNDAYGVTAMQSSKIVQRAKQSLYLPPSLLKINFHPSLNQITLYLYTQDAAMGTWTTVMLSYKFLPQNRHFSTKVKPMPVEANTRPRLIHSDILLRCFNVCTLPAISYLVTEGLGEAVGKHIV